MYNFLVLSLLITSTLAFGQTDEQRRGTDCFYAARLQGVQLKTDYDAWSSENELKVYWSVYDKVIQVRETYGDPMAIKSGIGAVYYDKTIDRYNSTGTFGYLSENLGTSDEDYQAVATKIDAIPASKVTGKNKTDRIKLSYTMRELNLIGYSTVIYADTTVDLRKKNFKLLKNAFNKSGKVYTHYWVRETSNDDATMYFKFYRGCKTLNPEKVTQVHEEDN